MNVIIKPDGKSLFPCDVIWSTTLNKEDVVVDRKSGVFNIPLEQMTNEQRYTIAELQSSGDINQ